MEGTAQQDEQSESLDTTGFVIAPMAAAAELYSAACTKTKVAESIPATWEEWAHQAWEYYVEEPLVMKCVNSWGTSAVGDEIKITSDDETPKQQDLEAHDGKVIKIERIIT